MSGPWDEAGTGVTWNDRHCQGWPKRSLLEMGHEFIGVVEETGSAASCQG